MARTSMPPEPDQDAGVEEIERDLARTREQLGRSVEELADRLAMRMRPLTYGAAALVVTAAVAVGVVMWRRRR